MPDSQPFRRRAQSALPLRRSATYRQPHTLMQVPLTQTYGGSPLFTDPRKGLFESGSGASTTGLSTSRTSSTAFSTLDSGKLPYGHNPPTPHPSRAPKLSMQNISRFITKNALAPSDAYLLFALPHLLSRAIELKDEILTHSAVVAAPGSVNGDVFEKVRKKGSCTACGWFNEGIMAVEGAWRDGGEDRVRYELLARGSCVCSGHGYPTSKCICCSLFNQGVSTALSHLRLTFKHCRAFRSIIAAALEQMWSPKPASDISSLPHQLLLILARSEVTYVEDLAAFQRIARMVTGVVAERAGLLRLDLQNGGEMECGYCVVPKIVVLGRD